MPLKDWPAWTVMMSDLASEQTRQAMAAIAAMVFDFMESPNFENEFAVRSEHSRVSGKI
jgi:hypothetical protein